MKVMSENVRVVSKNFREGENERGPWQMYEISCGNGEGALANFSCSKEIYEKLVPFEEVTAEFEIFNRGYNLRGEMLAFYK